MVYCCTYVKPYQTSAILSPAHPHRRNSIIASARPHASQLPLRHWRHDTRAPQPACRQPQLLKAWRAVRLPRALRHVLRHRPAGRNRPQTRIGQRTGSRARPSALHSSGSATRISTARPSASCNSAVLRTSPSPSAAGETVARRSIAGADPPRGRSFARCPSSASRNSCRCYGDVNEASRRGVETLKPRLGRPERSPDRAMRKHSRRFSSVADSRLEDLAAWHRASSITSSRALCGRAYRRSRWAAGSCIKLEWGRTCGRCMHLDRAGPSTAWFPGLPMGGRGCAEPSLRILGDRSWVADRRQQHTLCRRLAGLGAGGSRFAKDRGNSPQPGRACRRGHGLVVGASLGLPDGKLRQSAAAGEGRRSRTAASSSISVWITICRAAAAPRRLSSAITISARSSRFHPRARHRGGGHRSPHYLAALTGEEPSSSQQAEAPSVGWASLAPGRF